MKLITLLHYVSRDIRTFILDKLHKSNQISKLNDDRVLIFNGYLMFHVMQKNSE
jgi:hypothetical protein